MLIGKMMGIFLTTLKKRINIAWHFLEIVFEGRRCHLSVDFVDVKIANLCISVRDGASPFPFTDLHILPMKISFQTRKRSLGRPGLEPGTNPESFRGCSTKSTNCLQREHCEVWILFSLQSSF